jgi:hypothetical protein
MKNESWTLTGWPAVPAFLMLAVTPVLTTLIVSVPVVWLANRVFSASAIRAVFGVEHLGYWRVVGIFALFFAAGFKIKIHGSRNESRFQRSASPEQGSKI